uniref:Uncharacterized protein n=1 Tax=Cacopsylla melanoneura TaxID=428564 RepID=A0A8D8U7P9_9HEMI
MRYRTENVREIQFNHRKVTNTNGEVYVTNTFTMCSIVKAHSTRFGKFVCLIKKYSNTKEFENARGERGKTGRGREKGIESILEYIPWEEQGGERALSKLEYKLRNSYQS